LGVAFGTVLGWRRGKALDSVVTPFAITLAQMPEYLMALLLSLLFVYALPIFPSGGFHLDGDPLPYSGNRDCPLTELEPAGGLALGTFQQRAVLVLPFAATAPAVGDLALLSDADGVHLGQTDISLADARRIVGAERLIGLSTHTPEQFREAVRQAPDYIAVGPMFASSTKPQEHVPGPALLALAVGETSIPLVPVGGITPENLGILREAGGQRVCVCSAVIGADDPCAAAGRLSR
jgi:hypothetical protein